MAIPIAGFIPRDSGIDLDLYNPEIRGLQKGPGLPALVPGQAAVWFRETVQSLRALPGARSRSATVIVSVGEKL
jgi:hypothetical protein